MNTKLIAWLDARKILFETFAATLLALMAVVVSVAQSCSAQRQTELLDIQTRIARAQALPQISAVVELQFDPATERYEQDTIKVVNHGGLLRNLSGTIAVLAEMEIVSTRVPATPTARCSIALNGYYDALAHSPQGTGQVLLALGSHNNGRAADLERELRALASERDQFVTFDIERYLRIQYHDLLGESHTDYFHVRPVYGGALLQDSQAIAIFNSYRAANTSGGSVDFDGLSAVVLLDLCPRLSKH